MINKSQKVSSLENIYKNLESGMPENKSIKEYALPNARQWLGGRYLALWVLPIYLIRKYTSDWISDPNIDVIITTGGTGITARDVTPEAIRPLLDKEIDGFGETFRFLSFKKIGTSTLQSRCIAGSANGKFLFVLPGSKDAVMTGWQDIIFYQLNQNTKPCNLINLIDKLKK